MNIRPMMVLVVALVVAGAASAQENGATWQQELLRAEPQQLAAQAKELGDAQRGAIVFFSAHMACGKCHVHEKSLGAPDLTALDKKLSDAHLVESLLTPSKAIRAGFESTIVVTEDGRTLQGIVAEETEKMVALRDPLTPERLVSVAKENIEQRRKSDLSLMPAGQIEQLASRQQFLDLVRYLIELRDGGAERAKLLQPDPNLIAAAPLPEYEAKLNHAALIRGWNQESYQRGEAIYRRVCANCHGTLERPGSLPQSLRFGEGRFKNGSDPHSMYQTLTRGFGFMVPQGWMVPKQKYDVIHYIREAYLKPHNASQFVPVDAKYLAGLPSGDTLGPEPSKVEPWSAMDYGPSLINTYEIASGNFAFKGIAMRLDPGAGGVSRGQDWLALDHDTLRMAGAWHGAGFIDWRGIHFNGEHQAHPKVAGTLLASTATGPGWAHPDTGSLVDPRPLARDGRPYGPLPREWAQYLGYYAHGNQTIASYRVGTTKVLESPERIEVGRDERPALAVYARNFELGPRAKPLTLVLATQPDKALRGPLAGQDLALLTSQDPKSVQQASTPLVFRGKESFDVAHAEKINLDGADFSLVARLRATGDGTLLAQTAAQGPWSPDAKALFLRAGKLVFDIGWVGAVTARSKIADDKWHTVAMTWQQNQGTVRLYVDGKLDGEGTLKAKARLKYVVVRLGRAAEDFPSPSNFHGQMTGLAFYQRLLKAEEIAALGESMELPAAKSQLVAAWDLSQLVDGQVVDRSGHGHVAQSSATSSSGSPLIAGYEPKLSGAEMKWDEAGRLLLTIPAGTETLRFAAWLTALPSRESVTQDAKLVRQTLATHQLVALAPLTHGGQQRWAQIVSSQAKIGKSSGPFAIDVLTPPDQNPWLAQMRLSGVDFLADGDRAAVCTWDGDVWLVSGLSKLGNEPAASPALAWQRIASGLFQPLGLKIMKERIYVACRDQIVILNDLNQDGETDFYECYNNDHQVTEHFHEFAMGLQADDAGNLYYAKSARHGLPALIPHHGTLLRVSPGGERTDILANGFRAANGVCLNPDGSFLVTDQEGFWNPKNRINWVTIDPRGPPKFYGNMLGYHDQKDASDAAMEPPLCWITNAFDRSPAELLWVTSDRWGPLRGSLLNLSYGYGKVFLVLHEKVQGQMQGGMIELPIPAFPTGVMRGRFHPGDGQLYLCGMFAWAGNATSPGGFYRLRYTGAPLQLPLAMHAHKSGVTLRFAAPLDRAAATLAKDYEVKVWGLRRTANYGSPHVDEHSLLVRSAKLSDDGLSVELAIDDLQPTWGMEIRYKLQGSNKEPIQGTIHNTVHHLAD